MNHQLHSRSQSVPWHTTYLSVTAIGIGLLLGISEFSSELPATLELAPAGLVVAMFTVTSLLYWYDVAGGRRRERPR